MIPGVAFANEIYTILTINYIGNNRRCYYFK